MYLHVYNVMPRTNLINVSVIRISTSWIVLIAPLVSTCSSLHTPSSLSVGETHPSKSTPKAVCGEKFTQIDRFNGDIRNRYVSNYDIIYIHKRVLY